MTDTTDDDGTMSLADLDEEIERLKREKQRVKTLLQDPDESRKRRARRGIAFGRWAETVLLTGEQMQAARALADEDDRHLFGDDVLQADGWRYDKVSDRWYGPSVPARG